jgi:hypothetical protein
LQVDLESKAGACRLVQPRSLFFCPSPRIAETQAKKLILQSGLLIKAIATITGSSESHKRHACTSLGIRRNMGILLRFYPE